MDQAKIFLEDGTEKLVDCIFYLYNSKYYFLYTENEVDENGYVRLYLVKVGKETTNTPNGPVETGNMVGIEVPSDEEWKEVQTSISKIVNSKKTKVEDKDIQYLPIEMLVRLKVMSKKTFRLLATIIENDFGLKLNINSSNTASNISTMQDNNSIQLNQNNSYDPNLNKPIEDDPIDQTSNELVEIPDSQTEEEISSDESEIDEYDNPNIIIDYRTRFFEEQEKNKRLNEEIDKLKKKLENIDGIIKGD